MFEMVMSRVWAISRLENAPSKTKAARLAAAPLDQFGMTVKPAQTNPLARCEFATLRERPIEIEARVIEYIARSRVQLPTSRPEGALFHAIA